MDDKRFALLIDSDNVSSKYIDGILDELSQYGVVTYRRIYGDFTRSTNAKWSEKLLEKSIIPIQQFSNTTGKNATDSALIIDAMDLLYANHTDGFCIVSSDSDFTRLASRLRESGKTVIGMGEKKTPDSFRAACTVFTELENLLEEDSERHGETISKEVIQDAVINILTQNENHGKMATGSGEIGSKLRNKYPDFDIRNYGYTQLSRFLADVPGIKLTKIDNSIEVSLGSSDNVEEVIRDIKNIVKRGRGKAIALSHIGQEIRKTRPNFNVKLYGYTQLYQFIGSIPGLAVSGDKNDRKVILTESFEII